MLVLSMWLLGGLVGYAAAERRGFSKPVGVICGLLLGPLFAWVMFWVSGVVTRNDFRGGVGPVPSPRPRRSPLTVALVGVNALLGLIVVALLIVRYGAS